MGSIGFNWSDLNELRAQKSRKILQDTDEIKMVEEVSVKRKTDWFGFIAAVVVIAVVVLILKLT